MAVVKTTLAPYNRYNSNYGDKNVNFEFENAVS